MKKLPEMKLAEFQAELLALLQHYLGPAVSNWVLLAGDDVSIYTNRYPAYLNHREMMGRVAILARELDYARLMSEASSVTLVNKDGSWVTVNARDLPGGRGGRNP